MRTDSLLPSFVGLGPRAGRSVPAAGPARRLRGGRPDRARAITTPWSVMPGGSSNRPATSVSVRNTSCLPWPGFGHVSRLLRREGTPAAGAPDDFHDVSDRPQLE